jgi:hypothetical protein
MLSTGDRRNFQVKKTQGKRSIQGHKTEIALGTGPGGVFPQIVLDHNVSIFLACEVLRIVVEYVALLFQWCLLTAEGPRLFLLTASTGNTTCKTINHYSSIAKEDHLSLLTYHQLRGGVSCPQLHILGKFK